MKRHKKCSSLVVVLFLSVFSVNAHAGGGCAQDIAPEFDALAQETNAAIAQKKAADLCRDLHPGSNVEWLEYRPGVAKSVACLGPQGPEGPAVSWHSNGKVASRGQITSQSGDPKLCGKWQRYFENGELRDEGLWADGRPAGDWQVREQPGLNLSEMKFDPVFERTHEWSVLAGVNYFHEFNREQSPSSPNRTDLPGPTVSGRLTWRLFSGFAMDAIVGADFFVARVQGSFGSSTQASMVPFLMAGAYWTPFNARWRFGMQAGLLISLSAIGSSNNEGKIINPGGLFVAQYQLFETERKPKWFVELGSSPPIGVPWLVHALVGLRW